jgi:aspartate aminotransferase-like enzyme
MNPLILLNPGPVSLSKRVRDALGKEDLCHREPEFSLLQESIRKKLISIYNLDATTWASVLLTGSGTAAVEAMIASLVPENQRILIVENGVYGERMTKIAHAHGIKYDVLNSDWLDAIEGDELETILEQKQFSHMALAVSAARILSSKNGILMRAQLLLINVCTECPELPLYWSTGQLSPPLDLPKQFIWIYPLT